MIKQHILRVRVRVRFPTGLGTFNNKSSPMTVQYIRNRYRQHYEIKLYYVCNNSRLYRNRDIEIPLGRTRLGVGISPWSQRFRYTRAWAGQDTNKNLRGFHPLHYR